MMKFRKLKADEIDVRIGTVPKSGTGLSLLLYKDARVDMNILDESVGTLNWQRKHELIDGQLFCNVSVWDETKKEWITKQDVGIESFTEEVKGRASDSFKRACTNLGIGRELYTAPFIWIPASKGRPDEIKKYKYRVSHISYDGLNIKNLSIEMNGKDTNYKWVEIWRNFKNTQKTTDEKATKTDITVMFNYAKSKGVSDYDIKKFMTTFFNKENSSDLTKSEVNELNQYIKSYGEFNGKV